MVGQNRPVLSQANWFSLLPPFYSHPTKTEYPYRKSYIDSILYSSLAYGIIEPILEVLSEFAKAVFKEWLRNEQKRASYREL